MSARIHCDADGCDESCDPNAYVPYGWLRVEYFADAVDLATDVTDRHFSSTACLASWASINALAQLGGAAGAIGRKALAASRAASRH